MRRKVGEEFKPYCVCPTLKHGGGSIMIWGCMGSKGVGKLYICEGRMDSFKYTTMLDDILVPSAKQIFQCRRKPRFLFQQDNAPCHTSRHSTEYFKKKNICKLEWVAQSPDLNPIEHLWAIVKKQIRKHNPTSKKQLYAAIKEEWYNIPVQTCAKLVHSMPKRINEVIKAKGGATRY